MRNTISLFLLACALGLSAAAQAANPDNGRTSYANNCASCHSTPWATSAAAIQSAIQRNKGGMGRLTTLTASELQDIAAYMADPSGTTATANTTTGTTGTSTTATPPTTASVPTGTAAPTSADLDRLYDWAEATYPQLFTHHGFSQDVNGYYTRYYLGTNLYLMSRDGMLYFMDGNRNEGMLGLGKVVDWLSRISLATSGTRPTGQNGENHAGDNNGNNKEGDRDKHDDRDDHEGHDDD